jgi:cobalamin synthase
MRRDLAFPGVARQAERPARSIACLAFVGILAGAFWAGAALIAQSIMRSGFGF